MLPIHYRKLRLEDAQAVRQLTKADAGLSDHIWWESMFLMQYMYDDHFAFWNNCLIRKPHMGNNEAWCLYPIGSPKDRKHAAQLIYNHFNRLGQSVVFYGASWKGAEEMRELFGERVVCEEKRDEQNYMLSIDEQIKMSGGRFADRRKLIHRFENSYDWSYVDLTSANMAECLRVNQEWYDEHDKSSSSIHDEQRALKCAAANFDALHLEGGMIYVDQQPVAFCIGAPFNDKVYGLPFCKSCHEYKDSMLVLLQNFMEKKCAQYEFFNCSNDLGIAGIRMFKTKLRPAFLTDFVNVSIQTSAPNAAPVRLKNRLRALRKLLSKGL